MSDVYIWLQEKYGFTEEDIENLTILEIEKYTKEYISENK